MSQAGPFLTKEAILNAADLDAVTVEVPEWGGSVRMSEVSALDRERFERAMFTDQGEVRADAPPLRTAVLALVLTDENGRRLFTDSEVRDLAKKNGAVIARLFARAQEVAGIGPAAMEQAEKN